MSFLKIRAISHHLPEKCVLSEQLDELLGLPIGTVLKKSGLRKRHFIDDNETAASLGAKAALKALAQAKLSYKDIDLIIGACGVGQQPIPCTAALIQAELGWQNTAIPCFDVNSTCLSFLTALDVATALINNQQYSRILLVASDYPSRGVNWNDLDTCTIFGDGAAACIVEKTTDHKRVLASQLMTLSKGINYCKLDAGGTKIPPSEVKNISDAFFEMDGKSVFKIASQTLPELQKSIFEKAKISLNEIDFVIPHQASALALKHMGSRLDIPEDKFVIRFPEIGNQMAASIPTVLSLLLEEGNLKQGQMLYLLGTGAGFAAAATILEF